MEKLRIGDKVMWTSYTEDGQKILRSGVISQVNPRDVIVTPDDRLTDWAMVSTRRFSRYMAHNPTSHVIGMLADEFNRNGFMPTAN